MHNLSESKLKMSTDRDAKTCRKTDRPVADNVHRSFKSVDSVALWDCSCGYSSHDGVKTCPKCGNRKPNTEADGNCTLRIAPAE